MQMNESTKVDRSRRPPAALVLLAALGLWLGAAPAIVAQTPPPAPPPAEEDITLTQRTGASDANVVALVNQSDGRMRVRGNVDVSRIPGDTAGPVNYAAAVGACRDCQTFAVALQIDLISRTANVVTPQNIALALNVGCTRCHTVAHAIQFVVQVDDPREVPDDVDAAVKEMDKELRDIAKLARDGQMDVPTADARINALLDRFRTLGRSLYQRQEATEVNSP
jgi:hypothetical protein